MKKTVLYIILILLTLSCERATEWDFEEPAPIIMVVEGVITNNPDFNYVRLSIPSSRPGDPPQPLSTPHVAIISPRGTHPLNPSTTENGLFTPSPPITGVIDEGYRLYIEILGFEFISSPVFMQPVAPLQELRYYELQYNPGYFVINPLDESDPSYTEHICIYENPDLPGDTITRRFNTYRLATIDVNQFFKPAAERLVFPEGTMVIRKKYSLSNSHQQFIRAMLSETEWNGGWFDVVPGNLETNMSSGAIGWFGACSVLSDTTWLQ